MTAFNNRYGDETKTEWLTPPDLLKALGPFDLDPCAPIARPWSTADRHYTIEDNGLCQEWQGRVWLNPPYDRSTEQWVHRLAVHGNGVALIFARTETLMWQRWIWPRADALLFIYGRLSFYHVTGAKGAKNSGAPSVLVAYGKDNAEAVKTCGVAGAFVALRG